MWYNGYMKKISRYELIKLLKNNNYGTFKDLAIISGYHEKSLIRLNSMLKKKNYEIIKKKKKPSRQVNNDLRDVIINDYSCGKYKSYREVYNNYKNLVSYSYICKLLSDIMIEKEILVIAKMNYLGKYYYVAIDYSTLEVLYFIKTCDGNIDSVLGYILNNYGIPSNVYFYHINCIKSILIKKYNISIIDNIKLINKRICKVKVIGKSITKYNIRYGKYVYSKDDFYKHVKRKVLRNNLIQFNNIRYKIVCGFLIKHLEIVDLYYSNDDVYIKYNGNVYQLIKDEKVTSRKGLSKYV